MGAQHRVLLRQNAEVESPISSGTVSLSKHCKWETNELHDGEGFGETPDVPFVGLDTEKESSLQRSASCSDLRTIDTGAEDRQGDTRRHGSHSITSSWTRENDGFMEIGLRNSEGLDVIEKENVNLTYTPQNDGSQVNDLNDNNTSHKRRHTVGHTRTLESAEASVSSVYQAVTPKADILSSFEASSIDIGQPKMTMPASSHQKAPVSPLVGEKVPVSGVEDAQSFRSFMVGELQPSPIYATTDVLWGQTERDRVYNALLDVPYQFERLLCLGLTICLNSFLSVFALLPIRVIAAIVKLANISIGAKSFQSKKGLRGDQMYDLLCALMFALLVSFLWSIRAGSIYFWVKDMTQEFLKLSVLHSALDLSDKICCSFSVDVLEALAASCTTLAAQQYSQERWRAMFNVASDFLVSLLLLLAHGSVLMAQALVFGIAMNSQKNTLVALLIASNFTEIKGTVFKRFDPVKLFTLTKQDIVERFHMMVALAFVLAEEAAGRGTTLPSWKLLTQCMYVLVAEVVIDIVKHAVVGKFNEIRPGMYREFTKDLCEQVTSRQSHNIHKLVGFEPFGPAALFLRVVLTFTVTWTSQKKVFGKLGIYPSWLAWLIPLCKFSVTFVVIVLLWLSVAILTVSLGYLMKCGAAKYVEHYDRHRGKFRGNQSKNRSNISSATNNDDTCARNSNASKKIL